jgi:adenylate cyclase
MDRVGSPSPSPIEIDSIIKKSQTRVWKTLRGEPEFILSVAETQNILDKFANSKIDLVILNVDLVASTKLSMTLPLDKLRIMIQSFNQEMSLIVKDFGGFVLKYVGDAVLAFFVVASGHKSQGKVACTHAISCAKCMLEVARGGLNPILNQYECPQMNIRIEIDMGENAIIQSGWDIHPGLMKEEENGSVAVKMTTLANPNHIVIVRYNF